MSINSDFYKRGKTSRDSLSERAYMMAITAFTACFILIAMVGASFSYNWIFDANQIWMVLFLFGCMIVSVLGGTFAQSSNEPILSLIGGSICAGAMGLMIGPFVALYEAGSVIQAFTLTAGVVLITGFIGAALPQNLSAWGAPLFGLLLGAIVIQFGGIFLSVLGVDMQPVFTLLDWAVLILFCAIMVYDLNRAKQLSRTLDNAIDVAVNVFLNFANIFIRVLAILGKKK